MKSSGCLNRRSVCVVLLATAMLLASARPASAASASQVDASVKKAVAWIYSKQKPAGHWENNPRPDPKLDHNAHEPMDGTNHGGWTAICLFALLEAGEKVSDPRVAKAIEFLRRADLRTIYSVGLRCMVFSKLPPTPENLSVLQADAVRLQASVIPEGEGRGLWGYEVALPGQKRVEPGSIDHSVSQFGVLGLWACSRAGVDVPAARWRELEQIWRKNQNGDGGWSYDSVGSDSKAGMTCAGVATLLIIQDVLGSLPASAGVSSTSDVALTRGLAWLDKNFDRVLEERTYALYAAERIGTAAGYRMLGRHDWYQRGANWLIKNQKPDGHWSTDQSTVPSTPVSETAFGVLFLVHGRAPVLLSKLNYSATPSGLGRDQSWNQRPRDAANLVRYTANAAEQPYNWQVNNLNLPTADLLDTPVMYVTGSKPLVLLEREREKLKLYLEGGGMLLASSEAAPTEGVTASDPFSRSVVDLGRRLFNYQFRELPPEHPIFTQQQFRGKQWTERPVVWGLSNGVRELIVLLPMGDHGRSWNVNAHKADAVKFEIGANILQYAVSRTPPPAKGMSHVVRPKYLMDVATTRPATLPATAPATAPAGSPTEPPVASPPADGASEADPTKVEYLKVPANARRMVVGRLKVGGNWDPEPGAWPRIATILANDFQLFAEIRPVEPIASQLTGIDLLHWTGTTPVTLDDRQRSALLGFVRAGGTIAVDAAGGSAAFADSVKAELQGIFNTQGEVLGTVLAPDDPVYRQRDARIEKFEYRRFFSTQVSGRLNTPLMQGIDRSGRTIVFFSREDLTAGCVGQNTDGIYGYAPATATAIMRNIALLAAKK